MVLLKDLFEEAMNKNKKTSKPSFRRNKYGLFRVCKVVNNRCRNDSIWKYTFRKNYKSHAVTATNLIRLKERVLDKNLPFIIIDEELARQTVEIEGLNWDSFVKGCTLPNSDADDSLDDDKSESLKELGIVKEGYAYC